MPGRADVLCLLPLGTPPLIIQLPAGPHCSARVTSVPIPVAYGRTTPALSEAVQHLAGLAPRTKKPAAAGNSSSTPAAQAVQWASAPDAASRPIQEQVRAVGAAFSAFPTDSKLRRLTPTDMHVCCAIEWGPCPTGGPAVLYVGTNSGYVHKVLVTPPPTPFGSSAPHGGRKRPREEHHADTPDTVAVQLAACTRLASLSTVSTLQWSPQQGGLLLAHTGDTHVDLLDPVTLELWESLPDFDRPSQSMRGCNFALRRGMVQLHNEHPLLVAANSTTKGGYVFAGYDTSNVGPVDAAANPTDVARLAVRSLAEEGSVGGVEWHPHAPILLVSNGSETVHAWVLTTDADWSAFSPYFPELGLNVEYLEREDEFDGVTEAQSAAAPAAAGNTTGEDDLAMYGLTARAAAAAFHVAPTVAQRIAAGRLPAGLCARSTPSSEMAAAPPSQQNTSAAADQQLARAAQHAGPVDVVGGVMCVASRSAAALQASQASLQSFRSNPDESFGSITVPLRMTGVVSSASMPPAACAPAPLASGAGPAGIRSAGLETAALPTAAEAWQRAGSCITGLRASLQAALHEEGLAQMTAVGRARLGNAALYDASGGYFAAAPSAAAQQQ